MKDAPTGMKFEKAGEKDIAPNGVSLDTIQGV